MGSSNFQLFCAEDCDLAHVVGRGRRYEERMCESGTEIFRWVLKESRRGNGERETEGEGKERDREGDREGLGLREGMHNNKEHDNMT